MHIKQAAFLTGVASTVFITNAQEIAKASKLGATKIKVHEFRADESIQATSAMFEPEAATAMNSAFFDSIGNAIKAQVAVKTSVAIKALAEDDKPAVQESEFEDSEDQIEEEEDESDEYDEEDDAYEEEDKLGVPQQHQQSLTADSANTVAIDIMLTFNPATMAPESTGTRSARNTRTSQKSILTPLPRVKNMVKKEQKALNDGTNSKPLLAVTALILLSGIFVGISM